MTTKRRVGIAGASGYGGAEVMRWIAVHPNFEVSGATSRQYAGRDVTDVHANLTGFHKGLRFLEQPEDLLGTDPDVVVLALPHKHAAEHARRLTEARPDLVIVDLSGDHRLQDPAAYEDAYGAAHPHPDELTSGAWAFGLCEANREAIAAGRRIANPGCFATGALLGALPLARRGWIAGPVRHAAITGSSGSGAEAKAGTHHPERVEDVKAYKVLAHQHVPEIVACLAGNGMAADTPWHMVPQSGPFARGIFTTLFVDLPEALDTATLRAAFDEEYADDLFARLRDGTPRVGHVRNTNFCDIAVHAEGRQAVVLTAIDNLGKGMATQAVQNLNIVFDRPETEGLRVPGGKP